jgi:iron complex outermembrane recepter protein
MIWVLRHIAPLPLEAKGLKPDLAVVRGQHQSAAPGQKRTSDVRSLSGVWHALLGQCVAVVIVGSLLLVRTLAAQTAPLPVAGVDEQNNGSDGTSAPPNTAGETIQPAPKTSGPDIAPATNAVTPPVLRVAPEPQLKPGQLAPTTSSAVRLHVTVGVDGKVTDPQVMAGIREDLDVLALETVKRWQFEPALRGDEPVSARIVVAVHFEGTTLQTPPDPADANAVPLVSGNAPSSIQPELEFEHTRASEPTPEAAAGPSEVVVKGDRFGLDAPRSTGDFSLKHDVLDAAPHHEGVDVLRAAPGLYMGRAEGGAVAHRYMLRGFDSEHGQDIEFRVGGVPINLPSHIHGQGYADLGFLIGDAVQELRVTEGVHDPRQGDFAVAGSIDVKLGVVDRGVKVRTSYGSFNTFGQLVSWAPKDALPDTFVAVDFRHTDGFGVNRGGERASSIVQQGFTLLDWRVRLLGVAYATRSDLAGFLRRDDIVAGRVGYYDVYPYATAQAQNALGLRGLLGVFGEYNGLQGDIGELGFWMGRDRFRIQQNLTGFLARSVSLDGVAGRGDLIEQRNWSDSIGFSARYRTEAKDIGPWHVHLELGTSARLDQIEQQQNLLDASVRGQTWDQRVAAEISGSDVGLWVDTDFHLAEWFKLRVGYRADLLGYEVDDALGNRAAATRDVDSFIPGFRRSAMGIAHGPRVSADLELWAPLTLHASYGEGYRSPQARTLGDGETAPFSKVRSADVGGRITLGLETQLTASLYHTHLSDDVAFDAVEGRLERVGATTRRGAVVHVESRPWEGFVGAVSVTYVDAELLEPPPPSAEEPEPAFEKGQNLPFVPPLVARADVSFERAIVAVASEPLKGRLGLGVSSLGVRPLPYGSFGQAFTLLDGSLTISYGIFSAGFSAYNLLNLRYPAAEYAYVSNWSPESPPSRLPARHIAAGAPRTLMASLELKL